MKTTSQFIYEFLKKKKTWQWGGVIEDHLRAVNGSKGETTSRRLRELAKDKIIDHRYGDVKGKLCVQYRIAKKKYIYQNRHWIKK